MTERKTPNDWTTAALEAIADSGVASVSVERLAIDLGVTKGSFYWHFKDRAALITSALLLWEQQGTDAVIDLMNEIEDPHERLAGLIRLTVTDAEHGPVDVALAARANDPLVGPIVQRVTARRVAFVADVFRELGVTPAKAERRARIAVATYLGHFHLRLAMPDDKYLENPNKAYIDQLLESVANV